MPSITFSSELDNSKLDAAIKESKKNISEFVKDVERGGEKIDQTFIKNTKTFKEQIRDQKDLIKSIEKEIKNLQKAYEDSAPGTAKLAAFNELKSAKRALAEEQATLLGLQKQQIDANNRESGSQQGIIGNLKGWALGLMTVGALMKVFKGIMESTEKTSLAFHTTVNGLKAGVDYLAKSIATLDFTNFIQGMKEAIQAGRQYTQDSEKLANLRREYQIKEADLNKKIEEQRRIFYEDDKTSVDEKIKASDKMLEYMKQKAEMEIELAKESYAITSELSSKKNKMSEKDIDFAIKNYSEIEKIGVKYNALRTVYDSLLESQKQGMAISPWKLYEKDGELYATRMGGVTKVTQENIDSIKKMIDELGKEAPMLGMVASQYERLTEKEKDALQIGILNTKQAENQYNVESKRVYRMQQNLIDQKNKAIENAARVQSKIKVQEDLLNKAIDAGNQADIKSIGIKIAKLQEELALREKIARAAIAAAMQREAPISKISGTNIPTLSNYKPVSSLSGAPVTRPVSDYISGTAMLSDEGLRKQKKRATEDDKKAEESLERQVDLRNEILNSVNQLVVSIGELTGLDQDQVNALGGIVDSFTQLASGNLVGGVTSFISGLLASIPSQADKFAAQINRINALLEEQQRLINQSYRTGGTADALQQEIDLLERQRETLLENIKKERNKFAPNLKKLDDWTIQLFAVIDQIEDAQLALNDLLTGGVTQNTIADAITQGFQDGKKSVDDFGEYINQVLYDAVINIFKAELLGPAMNAVTDYIKQALQDNILSESETTEIKKQTQAIIDANKQTWKDLTDALDISNIAEPGLSGGIARQITEETGSELAGLMRKISDDNRMNRDYNKMAVDHLVGIEANTYGSWQELQKANTKLDTVITNTKPVLVNDLGG